MTTEIELMSISIGRGGISLSGGRGGYTWVPEFDLHDNFITTEAAPLASPRTAEPGGGTGTVVDTETKISISGSKAVFAGGRASPAYGDPGIWYDGVSRAGGLATLHRVNISTFAFACNFGWDGNNGGRAEEHSFWPRSTTQLIAFNGTTSITVGTVLATGVDYDYATILRTAGALYVARGGVYTDWTLLWVSGTGNTATVYPCISNYDLGFSCDDIKALPLPAPFSTDYGLATNRIAGAVSAGATFTHEADCIIEYTVTTLHSAGFMQVVFRKQDASNFWYAEVLADGTFRLVEFVAGVGTTRATAAAGVLSGHRCVVIADGTVIRGYSNNVLRWTYSSASNFAIETDGETGTIGTGGAMSDLIAWPRQLSGTAKAILDKAAA